jgi:hypothetical protein
MAEQNKKQSDRDSQADTDRDELKGDPREGDNEWLRDQVGEDHNLSGSSTYRTLPDQPEKDRSDDDTRDRQSNR